MKIVIEIDKKVYEHAKLIDAMGKSSVYAQIIANGTPLPKGHGDLIDRNHFDKLLRDYGLDYEADTFIPLATTVIEADREGDNNETDN